MRSKLLFLLSAALLAASCAATRPDNAPRQGAGLPATEPVASDFRVMRFSAKQRAPLKPSRFDTKVWAWSDGKALVFHFIVDTKGKQLRPAIMTQDDSCVWNDNSVAVAIDTNRDGSSYYLLIATDKGVLYDARCVTPHMVDTRWSSGATVGTNRGPTKWSATIRVPYRSLRAWPGAGDVIGLNFASFVYLAGSEKETVEGSQTYILDNLVQNLKGRKMFESKTHGSWNDSVGYDIYYDLYIRPEGELHELSAHVPFAYANVYHYQRRGLRPYAFKGFLLARARRRDVEVRVRTRGGLTTMLNPHTNSLQAVVANRGAKPVKVRASARASLTAAWSRTVEVAPDSIGLVDLPYEPIRGGRMRFRIAVDGRTVYSSAYDVLEPYRASIVPTFEGEFREDLVRRQAKPLGIGAMHWPHHYDYGPKSGSAPGRRTLLMGYGMELNQDKLVRDSVEFKTALVTTAGRSKIRNGNMYNELDEWGDILRKAGIRCVLIPFTGTYRDPKTKKRFGFTGREITGPMAGGWMYPFTEEAMENYLAMMRYGLKNYGDLIWAIYSTDELNCQTIHVLKMIWEREKHKAHSAFIDSIVKEIREGYGFGKFGPPAGPEDRNPFRRLAFHRWFTAKSIEMGKRIVREAKKMKPDVVVFGNDAHGFPYDAAWYPGVFDAVADQTTYFPSMPGNVDADVKYLADTTGLPVWPCAHIEGGARLPDAHELFSAVFRVGAEGLLTYNVASPKYTFHDIWCAPERYGYEKLISRLFAKGIRAKTPTDPDIGIFVSVYSMMSASLVSEPRRAEYVSCYRTVGAKCGGWMRFFNEENLRRNDVDLKSFKVIFVPYAPITTEEAARRILAAAADGATVVVTDPDAFAHGLDGTPLAEIGKELRSGGWPVARRSFSWGEFSAKWPGGRARPLDCKRFYINTTPPEVKTFRMAPDATAVIRAPDGSPCAYMHKHGKGRLIVCGLRLFYGNVDPEVTGGGGRTPSEDPNVVAFVRELLEKEGVKTDREIWKLKLPKPTYPKPEADGYCLTNNSIWWQSNVPVGYLNVRLAGRYKCDPAPDYLEDVTGKDGWTPFDTGRLTNAVRHLREDVNAARNWRDWVVGWQGGKRIRVVIDLGQICEVRGAEAVFARHVPEFRVSVSEDGENYTPLGDRAKGRGKTLDLIMARASGQAQARYVALETSKIPAGEKCVLAEIRVWGMPCKVVKR